MKHLINLKQLTFTDLISLLDTAQSFIQKDGTIIEKNTLKGKTVTTIFCEPSTRTRCSFELAAKKLGAHTLDLPRSTSSLEKAESLEDTFLTLQALGTDAFIFRHQEHGIMAQASTWLKDKSALINAGEGSMAHPTQALLDVLTIRQHKSSLKDLSVAIVGDSKHSRVARSTILALQTLGTTNIRLIAPELLLLDDMHAISTHHSLEKGLDKADIIIALRVQNERFTSDERLDITDYIQNYQLNEKNLHFAKPDAIIMHPGPINRGVEISADLAIHQRSAILQQVRNGVAVRMAVLEWVF